VKGLPNQSKQLVEHLSAGNLGLFAIITERRKLRIYWPRPELLCVDWAEEEELQVDQNHNQDQKDAFMVTTK